MLLTIVCFTAGNTISPLPPGRFAMAIILMACLCVLSFRLGMED